MREHEINLGTVDLITLISDEDLEREATRWIPDLLRRMGETAAEEAWDTLQSGLRSAGLAPNRSASDKRRWVEDAGRTYARDANAETREEARAYLIRRLRDMKERAGS